MSTPLPARHERLFDENDSPVPDEIGLLAHRIGAIALFALIAMQFIWHLAWLPPERVPVGIVLALMVIPLAVPAFFLLFGAKKALFWAGFIAMLHFCHGVMEAWSSSTALVPGLIEATLAAIVCCAAGWHGLARRVYWRKLVNQASE
ncbi:MAG: DUF2069 domain-containing protein [Aquimonas sp.]|nr:DUF2069 domain-containing protein [Aquimonas sp.]